MMVFNQLISVGSGNPPVKPVQLSWILTIDGDGNLLDVEKAPKNVRTANFQWDRGRKVEAGTGPVETLSFMLGFKNEGEVDNSTASAYITALDGISKFDPLRFSKYVSAFKTFAGKSGRETVIERLRQLGSPKQLDWCMFRVLGEPDWNAHPDLIRYHESRLAASQAAKGDVFGDCPFCGSKNVLMTRLYAKSGPAALISFNQPSTEAYGKTQGFVAPSCIPCSSAMTRGLTELLQNHGMGWASEGPKMLWWNQPKPETSDNTSNIWSVWRKLWSASDEPATAVPDDLRSFGRTPAVFLVLEQNMARWAIRAYEPYVDMNAVADRVSRWIQVFGDRWVGLIVNEMMNRQRANSASPDSGWDRAYMSVMSHLIGGHPLPKGYALDLEMKRLTRSEDKLRVDIIEKYLAYTRGDAVRIEKGGGNLTGTELGHYLLGRAFRRAAENHNRTRSGNKDKLFKMVCDYALKPATVSAPFIQTHLKDTKYGADPTGFKFYREALACGVSDTTPNFKESAAFMAGYRDQSEEDKARIEAAIAQRSTSTETE